MKLKSLLLLPVVLLFSACESAIEGSLSLSREILAIETIRGRDNGDYPGNRPDRERRSGRDIEKEIKLLPGNWDMTVSRDGKRKVVFQVKDARKKTHRIVLKTPQGGLPESGAFELLGSVTGQPFDVKGSLETQISETELRRDREQCSYSSPYTVCGGTGRGYRCWTEWRTVWGMRNVEYYDRTETQSLNGEIFEKGSSAGTFLGDRSESERIYTYEGSCF